MAATLFGKPDSIIVEQAVNIGAFDTLATARELESAGLERGHAEAIANAMRKAVGANRDDLSTKADVGVLRTDLDAMRTDLDAVRSDLDAVRTDVDAMRSDLAVVRSELGHFVTRGEFYRGLWIQGAGIIAVLTALRFLPI